ncbi:DUF4340 domain-containing protein [Intestinimonas butyriciproducens]|uniref:DUF4340 domain-containing protein n=1 Tax=Intestinimonas butyriciproducens TaxID=1297617 RepID=UPI00232F9D0A|nr:DUF4340 domain-containing protein [Intestinimonas butyriciproducens]MDB7816485.1 DUF4340 domain-containing protein [Intestinimonas butyriciproducens]MDB7842745.1 DUF4340 domain-containing protein [Intestinimonas butyriciproducens]MDB7857507.1 DUF4340 domain-containing protein [Intestinimonas butyriciproducens]
MILLGLLLAACAATLGVIRYEEHKEVIRNSDAIVLEIDSDAVQTLSWEYGAETLAFHKEDTWLYDGDAAFPVDEEKIQERLELFRAFGVSFIIEDVEDYGQYGLDKPICTIRLSTADETWEILLGNYSSMDSQRYVSVGDGNVYLVQNDPLDYFDAGLSDMIDHDETPDFDKVTGIRFAGTESYSITYEEDSGNTYCEEDVYFAERAGSLLPLDTSRVDAYLQKISGLSLTDYVTYNATAEELEACGLDTPELTVTVDYTYEDEARNEITQTFALQISRDPEEQKAAEEASDQEEGTAEEEITAYARVGDSRIVYRITANEYKALMDASYDALRHLEVLSADFSDVTQLDISLEGAAYSITAEGSGDGRTYSYLGEELEIGDLQSALESLKAESFTDERPTQKKEIGLTVHLDNENYPEVRIELYRYDGTNCLAVVDGTPVSLVARADVVDLIEAVNEIVLN